MDRRPPLRPTDALDDPPSRRRESRDHPTGRAQTVQDFAIGASIFLLTVSFVFAFVPSIFAPFSADVSPGSAQQANRVASEIVADYSMQDRPNWIKKQFVNDLQSWNAKAIRERFGLPLTAQINIQVVQLNDCSSSTCSNEGLANGEVIAKGGTDLVAGNSFNDRAARSVSRIVAIPSVDNCNPETKAGSGQVCRIVVRVW